jgi:hypothetical protein
MDDLQAVALRSVFEKRKPLMTVRRGERHFQGGEGLRAAPNGLYTMGEEERLLTEATPKRVLACQQFRNRLIRAVEGVEIRTSPRSPPRTVLVESLR